MSPTSEDPPRSPQQTAPLGAGATNAAGAVAGAAGGERDRVVDAVRSGALVVVVAGHWLMAAIGTEPTGGGAYSLQISNMLELRPWTQWLTWVLQVMPLFFIVGGFANAMSWQRTQAAGGRWADWIATRLRRLLAPTLPMVTVWLLIVAAAQPFLERRMIHAGHRLVTKPLWFLGVYLVVTAMTPLLVRLQARLGWWAAAPWVAAAVLIDVTRFGDHDTALAGLNFVFVWVALAQAGMIWDRLVANRHRWWVLVAAGYGTLAVMVGAGPYNISMVGVAGEVSNMAPPSVALVALGCAQLGLILVCWNRLGRLLDDDRYWRPVVKIGAGGMTLYLWHLTAVAIAVCIVALGAAIGIAQPTPGTGLWWATRPLWFGVLIAILSPILAKATPVEVRSLLAPKLTGIPTWAAVVGIFAGAGTIGYLVIEGLQPVGRAAVAIVVLAGLIRWLSGTEQPTEPARCVDPLT